MSVRARYKLHVSVSSTTDEERDLANPQSDVYTDALGEGGSAKYLVAGSATLLPLQLPQVASAKLLMIKTSVKDPTQTPVALEFRKNSTTGEVWTVVPLGTSKEGILLTTCSGITEIYCSNSSAIDMEVTVVMAGD